MKLVIETWWNKLVNDEGAQFGKRVLPDNYVMRDKVEFEKSGYSTRQEFFSEIRNRNKKTGLVFLPDLNGGAFKIETGKYFGIKSYQILYLED